MGKPLTYYISKIQALRNANDELLREMEAELKKSSPAKVPPKRQNKKEQRVINFEAFYNNRKIKTK